MTTKNDVKVREVSVEQLFVSLEETRKTIDQSALKELADSITKNGVIEALLVRSQALAPWSIVTDGAKMDSPGFEIIAGQRRWMASRLAGLTTVPCVIREMSDDEARETRVISNDQREDLPPMEQAEAYGKLLERPGATIETVAAALGRLPSYVGRRLKLLDAIEPVREALKCSAIEVGHALDLARLSRKQQQDLLEYLSVGYSAPDGDDDDDDDGEVTAELVPGSCAICNSDDAELADNELTWANPEHTVCSDPDCVAEARKKKIITVMVPTRVTVAELRSRIARTELRVLRDVPFPLDGEIPPIAYTACPKRAAGAASLFADVAEDTCTDPECLQAKLQMWVKAQLYNADQEGRKLAMLYDGHASEKAGVSRWNCVVGAGCGSAEPAIWISGSRIGHCIQICRDKKCSEHGEEAKVPASTGGTKGGIAKPATAKQSAEEKRRTEAQAAERAKMRKRVEAEKAYRERLWREMAAAQVPDKAEALIARLACARIAAQGGGLVALALGMASDAFDYGKQDAAVERVAALPQKTVLRAAALGMVVTDIGVSVWNVTQGQKPKRMEEMAAALGLDVAAIRAGMPVKAGAKGAVKTAKAAKTKPVLSAAAKKRIAEAQKKRWAAAKKPSAKPAKKGGRA